jgi:hypothetical protein
MQGASLHELRPGTVQKHTERLSTRSTRNGQKCLDVLDERFLESVLSLRFDDSSPLRLETVSFISFRELKQAVGCISE